jgi:hypothetical protein
MDREPARSRSRVHASDRHLKTVTKTFDRRTFLTSTRAPSDIKALTKTVGLETCLDRSFAKRHEVS